MRRTGIYPVRPASLVNMNCLEFCTLAAKSCRRGCVIIYENMYSFLRSITEIFLEVFLLKMMSGFEQFCSKLDEI